MGSLRRPRAAKPSLDLSGVHTCPARVPRLQTPDIEIGTWLGYRSFVFKTSCAYNIHYKYAVFRSPCRIALYPYHRTRGLGA